MTSRSLPRLVLALLPAVLLAGPSRATVVAGFEAGLGSVTTVGNAYVVDGSFGAGIPQGSYSLFLSTFPNGAGQLGPLTGSAIEQTLPAAVATATLESFLGLAAGDLDAISPSNPTVEGSAAQVSFTIPVPMDLHLDFILLSNETDAWAPNYTDFFFTTLTGEGAVEHRSVADPLVASPGTVFDRDSGWLSVDWVGLAPGTYTLGFGLVDVGDSDLGTALLVDNITLIPEPRVAVMLFLGLGGIWVAGRPRPRPPTR